MPKVLVTGCAGLIGSHLVDALLTKGYDVVGLDDLSVGRMANIEENLEHHKFKFRVADVSDLENVLKCRSLCKKLDAVIHLASRKKLYETNQESFAIWSNVQATKYMLEIARLQRKVGSKMPKTCKFVFASSSDVYGHGKVRMKETNDLCLGPSNIKRWGYAVSKLYEEHLCFGYYKDFNVPIIVLRYFGCFGERASLSWSGGHAMVFIDALLKNKEIVIHGNGKQTRSMCHVSDIVDGTIKALETPEAVGEIINLGGKEEMSVLDFAKFAAKVLNKTPQIRFVPFKEVFGDYREILRRVPDLTKAEKLLGYKPKVSLEEAIKRTAEWIEKQERTSASKFEFS